jgi:hypothetical protein
MSFFSKIVENKGIALAIGVGVAALGLAVYEISHIVSIKITKMKIHRQKQKELMTRLIYRNNLKRYDPKLIHPILH